MAVFGSWLWLGYLGGALVFSLVCWSSIKSLRPYWLQNLLLSALLTLLFTPWVAMPGSSELAPAVMISLYEGLFDNEGTFWRGAVPIVAAFVIVQLLLSLYYLVKLLLKRRGSDRQPKSEKPSDQGQNMAAKDSQTQELTQAKASSSLASKP